MSQKGVGPEQPDADVRSLDPLLEGRGMGCSWTVVHQRDHNLTKTKEKEIVVRSHSKVYQPFRVSQAILIHLKIEIFGPYNKRLKMIEK